MWDWSGSKNPPPVRSRSEAAQEAQNQGVTPMRREVRSVPIYRDTRAYRTLPPTAPASTYPDPLDVPAPQSPYSTVPPYPQQQASYQRPVIPPQAPPSYPSTANMPFVPQPYMNYPQQTPYQPPYMAGSQPYMSYPQQQNFIAQPSYPQPYHPPYTPQMPQSPSYGQQNYSVPQQQITPNQATQTAQMTLASAQQEDKALWEWNFQQTGLVNMDLIEADFVPLDPSWLLELRKAFKRTRRDFLKYVGYHHVNELLAAGMSEDAIKLVKKGKAPENFNIHIRVPFDYGGTNSFSNLVLIQTHPFHAEIHRFIDMQTLTQPNLKPRKLFLPAPKGKVYFPGEIEVSSGGTSRHDRSVYAGFLESTFEMIAQKSSLGR